MLSRKLVLNRPMCSYACHIAPWGNQAEDQTEYMHWYASWQSLIAIRANGFDSSSLHQERQLWCASLHQPLGVYTGPEGGTVTHLPAALRAECLVGLLLDESQHQRQLRLCGQQRSRPGPGAREPELRTGLRSLRPPLRRPSNSRVVCRRTRRSGWRCSRGPSQRSWTSLRR